MFLREENSMRKENKEESIYKVQKWGNKERQMRDEKVKERLFR